MTTPVTRPSPRFVVLTIEGNGDDPGYVVFDSRTGRVSYGVYCELGVALDVAAFNEEQSAPAEDWMPTTEELGLRFPAPGARAGANGVDR